MKIKYANGKVERYCTSIKAATKLFGGDKRLAKSLLARINAIEQAGVIKDIIVMPTFRFHKLQGDLKEYFAIDVKTSRDKWRIILQPLDENEEPFNPLKIDEIAMTVKIVEIREVSAHYE
ncbi:MAG: type II toxin-antitoxin system RelE/ParE family toxin [Lachnospiraceae bacterium]|nr:type II toxin-antitoxin system RelE/ParE family toxin [Lachnospiraceae bacterium]